MYELDFDATDRVLRIRLHGFWNLDVAARFARDAFAAGADIRRHHPGFAILTDSRDCPVQSPEVAQAMSDIAMRSAAVNPAPNATVLSSALAAMQGRRVLLPPNYRIFLDYEEADAWIDAEWVRRRDI